MNTIKLTSEHGETVEAPEDLFFILIEWQRMKAPKEWQRPDLVAAADRFIEINEEMWQNNAAPTEWPQPGDDYFAIVTDGPNWVRKYQYDGDLVHRIRYSKGNFFRTEKEARNAVKGLHRVGWQNLRKIGAAEIGDPFTELISRYQQMRKACYYLWDISRHRGTDADIPMRVVANRLVAIADRCGFREGRDNLLDWLEGIDEPSPADVE